MTSSKESSFSPFPSPEKNSAEFPKQISDFSHIETEQLSQDLANFKQKLQLTALTSKQQEHHLLLAKSHHPYLSQTQRFYNLRTEINPQLQENNWQHSLIMVDLWLEVKELCPQLATQYNEDLIIGLIISHDLGEWQFGDQDMLQQSSATAQNKKDREATAVHNLSRDPYYQQSTPSRLEVRQQIQLTLDQITSAYHIIYNERTCPESFLVKLLDQISGNITFDQYITQELDQLSLQLNEQQNSLIQTNRAKSHLKTVAVIEEFQANILQNKELALDHTELQKLFTFIREQPGVPDLP